MANQTARGTHVQQITCPPELQITLQLSNNFMSYSAETSKDFLRTYDHDIAQAGKYLEIFSADPGDAHKPPGQVCTMIFSSILTNQCIVTLKMV